ncbi:hypothetical protein [Rhodoplanes roseus]|uniref:Uncharacterized protein n=1 Tax=Rhodoplanes roseus TaxID=29409 RepID=A0A327KVF3_9BRAD|nr:hypothetical protein [Rhodoplanes roseus]RAI42809.1 hypothetical protein CH341_17600 [Rhodoplanes roseus]
MNLATTTLIITAALLPASALLALYAWHTPAVIAREGAETRRQLAAERTRLGALARVHGLAHGFRKDDHECDR